MKLNISSVLFVAALLTGPSISEQVNATPGTQLYLSCVNSGDPSCHSALSSTNLSGTTVGQLVTIGGYNSVNDGGGGTFVFLGPLNTACPTQTGQSGSLTAGSTQINSFGGSTTFAIDSVISGSGSGVAIPSGDQVVSFKTVGSVTTLNLSAPITGTGTSGSTNIGITGNNGGTLLNDHGNNDCLAKVDYRGDPHEWGAFGDGSHDDGTPLQSWLAAPGPWIASIPATYKTGMALTCWPYTNIEAPANNTIEGGSTSPPQPLVHISIGSSFPTGTGASPSVVLTALNYCRISGFSIDALFPGSEVSCIANTNCYIDDISIGDADDGGQGVVIDNHTILEHGYNNVLCPNITKANAGLQLKDSQFDQSFGDNIVINCNNVRIIGDVISLAGTVNGTVIPSSSARGIYATAEDITISNGNVEQSQGVGIDLNSVTLASVTGMFMVNNGEDTSIGGAGIEIDGGRQISVCGNHLKQNDSDETSGYYSAHVRFNQDSHGNSPSDISFCGNVYVPGSDPSDYPNYVYDISSEASASGITIYENPGNQASAIFSPNACTQSLNKQQVLPPAGTAGTACPIPPRVHSKHQNGVTRH